MSEDTKKAETPGEFLAAVAQRLAIEEGTDQGLASILATHILIGGPVEHPVTEAKAAIMALAAERAKIATAGTDA
jgi:hypothetical protein